MMNNATQKSLIVGIAALSMQIVAVQNAVGQDVDIAAEVDGDGNTEAILEEVLVTAQKRGEQRLLDVPISISVLGGEALDSSQFQGVRDALNQVAGLNLFTAGAVGGTQISVRGVTAGGTQFAGSGTAGFYLDGVPWGLVKTAILPDPNPYDLDRVEVLRGPQGTLYGANALNGVVRVITKDANLDEFEFKARTSVSSTNGGGENYRGDIAVNVPLVPGKLAARAILGRNDLSGWIDRASSNNANDAELNNFRFKINAQPNENLSIGLTAWLSRDEFGAQSQAPDTGDHPAVIDEPISTDFDKYGLTVNYEFESFSATSTTSYIQFDSQNLLDIGFGFTTLTTIFDSKVFSEELILTSTHDGPWQWSIGGFYRDAQDVLFQEIPIVAPAPLNFQDSSESFAIFGEVTRSFLDGEFDVTAGLRYFDDTVNFDEFTPLSGVPGTPLIRTESSFDKVTPRVVLTWYPSDDLTVYGSYSRGFRSGFNQNTLVLAQAPNFPSVNPDSLDNYEIGAKGTLLDGRVSFDSALYYVDWNDAQQTVGIPVAGSNIFVVAPVNSESVSGIGLDLSVDAQVTEALKLGLTLSWNDLTSDSQVLSSGVSLFEKGDRLIDSPEKTVGVTGEYSFPLGSYEGRLSGSVNYHSELVSRAIRGGALLLGEGDDITNVRFAFSVASEQWTATAFVDNATDEDGRVRADAGSDFRHTRMRPQTIGLQLEYQY